MTFDTFNTSSTREENVARDEGYEAGYEDGYEKGFHARRVIYLNEAQKLVSEYGLAVNGKDAEKMAETCRALFDALTGRER